MRIMIVTNQQFGYAAHSSQEIIPYVINMHDRKKILVRMIATHFGIK